MTEDISIIELSKKLGRSSSRVHWMKKHLGVKHTRSGFRGTKYISLSDAQKITEKLKVEFESPSKAVLEGPYKFSTMRLV